MLRLRRPRSLITALRRAAAVLLAVAALALAVRPEARARGPVTEPPVPVAVAALDLAAGSPLRAADLRIAGYPRALVPDGAVRDLDALRGRTLAAGVRAGEPVTDVRLVGAGLTALLPPGQVAAPLRPADLAVTGLVRVGDRLDVLASSANAPRAEVVAGGALVLAVPGRSADASGAAARAGPDGVLLVAVDSPTAARLAAASSTATLSVTLTGR